MKIPLVATLSFLTLASTAIADDFTPRQPSPSLRDSRVSPRLGPPAPTPTNIGDDSSWPADGIPCGPELSANETPEPTHLFETVVLTGYCHDKKCCGKYATKHKTKAGTDSRIANGIAADNDLLPLGTKVIIPGIGIRVVDDTGSAMRADARNGITHLDVRFKDHVAAKKFGRKTVRVEYPTLGSSN